MGPDRTADLRRSLTVLAMGRALSLRRSPAASRTTVFVSTPNSRASLRKETVGSLHPRSSALVQTGPNTGTQSRRYRSSSFVSGPSLVYVIPHTEQAKLP